MLLQPSSLELELSLSHGIIDRRGRGVGLMLPRTPNMPSMPPQLHDHSIQLIFRLDLLALQPWEPTLQLGCSPQRAAVLTEELKIGHQRSDPSDNLSTKLGEPVYRLAEGLRMSAHLAASATHSSITVAGPTAQSLMLLHGTRPITLIASEQSGSEVLHIGQSSLSHARQSWPFRTLLAPQLLRKTRSCSLQLLCNTHADSHLRCLEVLLRLRMLSLLRHLAEILWGMAQQSLPQCNGASLKECAFFTPGLQCALHTPGNRHRAVTGTAHEAEFTNSSFQPVKVAQDGAQILEL
mmetsp:Transcript_43783/g.78738  ORF Transcript_43783/g.78738 Transcript_43783/m.78738 type:complete len:294 (-) Transcript_43783:479-1360(-)